MSWLEKLMPARIRTDTAAKRGVPEGLWERCTQCSNALYKPELATNLYVCSHCDHHLQIGARLRLQSFLDEGTNTEIGSNLKPTDPLSFKDSKRYSNRLIAAQRATGESDALVALAGSLHGHATVACAFEFAFMGGSMGSVVGERFALAADAAISLRAPLVCFSATGGARMHEGLYSLMQMAKTAAAIGQLRRVRLPFVSVLTHPTFGGVSASLAMLGDINIGEPRALIGFAGPRVIEQTVRETLPDGFQRSEFLLQHGALDAIVDRRQMRDKVASMLAILMNWPQPVAKVAA